MEENKDFKSLFDLDDEEPTSDEKKNQQKSPEIIKLEEKVTNMEKSYKDQQELFRQKSEKMKELESFVDNVTGKKEEKEQAQKELELRKRFDEDSIGVMKEFMKENKELTKKDFSELENKVNLIEAKSKLKGLTEKIDKKYVVNWNNPKILKNMKLVSEKAKQEDPEGCLRIACQVAGELKPRAEGEMPFIEGGSSGTYTEPSRNEIEDYKKAIVNAKGKKIFKNS